MWVRWNIRVQEVPVIEENRLQCHHQVFLVREVSRYFRIKGRRSSLVFPAYCSNLIFKSLLTSQSVIHSMSAASVAFFSLVFGRVDSTVVAQRFSFVRRMDGCRTGTADGTKNSQLYIEERQKGGRESHSVHQALTSLSEGQ